MAIKTWNPELVQRIEEYLDQHFDALADIAEKLTSEERADEYKRTYENVALDGTGNGQVVLNGRQGYDRIMQRVTIGVTGATVGNAAFFIDSVGPGNLIEVITPAAQTALTIFGLGAFVLYSDAFDNNIYVPESSKLIVQFSGYTAGVNGYVNLQEKYLKKAEHTHSPRNMEVGNA